MDPLTEKDALYEARLNEVIFDTARSQVGLFFDLRGAPQLRMGHIRAAGPRRSSETQLEQRTAPHPADGRNAVASVPVHEAGLINLGSSSTQPPS
jgi:hypothetical protein